MSTNLQTVIGMLRRTASFDKLPAGQQAALRAQVSRMTRTTSDPQVAEVLAQIREVIGEAETRHAAAGMTAEDLSEEYATRFAAYDPRRRAAFKSRVTKLAQRAANDGDADTAAAMGELMREIARAEEAAAREEIRRLSEALGKRD